jgi:hypothetical protein
MVTRANSARKRLISICSAVTFDRLSAPFSVPSRCPLTQLNKVCSTSPNVRDAAAILWPDSTSRTASCLNSSMYRARVALIIGSPSLIVSYGIRLAGARSYLKIASHGVSWQRASKCRRPHAMIGSTAFSSNSSIALSQ